MKRQIIWVSLIAFYVWLNSSCVRNNHDISPNTTYMTSGVRNSLDKKLVIIDDLVDKRAISEIRVELSPDNFSAVRLLHGNDSLVKKYGSKAKNGVLIIYTKKYATSQLSSVKTTN